MTDPTAPLVRHVDDLPDEEWRNADRGGATWRTLFSRPVTPTSGLTTGVSSIPPGEALTVHRHVAVETYYVLEGNGVLTLGEDEHTVRAGSAVHLPSLTVHGLRNTGATTLRFFYAFATDSFADVVYDFSPPA